MLPPTKQTLHLGNGPDMQKSCRIVYFSEYKILNNSFIKKEFFVYKFEDMRM